MDGQIDLPEVEDGFRCILADIPWAQAARGGQKGLAKHNPTMSLKELERMAVKQVAAKDAWLFLWSHPTHLPDALKLMGVWGFEYSSTFITWVPLKASEASALMFDPRDSFHVGKGRTSRKSTQAILLGRRGSPKRLSVDIHELLVSPWREFGRKPEEAYERIEAYCDGPRLDLFSRESRDGWHAAGQMTGKFDNRWGTP